MSLPDFLVIGAAKSGTTSLISYLAQHPDIFVSRSKEPNYFALAGFENPPLGPAPPEVLQQMLYNWSRTDLDAYQALFKSALPGQMKGEGSVRYLYFRNAPVRIREMIPDARLVAVLRNPVSRLYSHYSMNRQIQLEPLDLPQAIAAEDERVAAGWGWDWHYVRAGLYGEQLQRYYELFPAEQIAVFLYDEFVVDPQHVLSAIYRHLGVDPAFRPDMSRRGMVTTLPRNLWLDRRLNWPGWLRRMLMWRRIRPVTLPVMKRLNHWNGRPVPRLDPGLRRELARRFTQDLVLLSDLTGRTLPWYQDL